MDEGLPSVSIFALVLVLLMDILVHGFGVALGHVREDEIEKRALESKDSISDKILKALQRDSDYIKDIQYFNIVVNMILGGLVTIDIGGAIALFIGADRDAALVRFGIYFATGLVISLIIMAFGVLVPRKLASRFPEKWVYACYYPVSFVLSICAPFVMISNGIASGLLYLFGVRGDTDESDVTEEEIKSMVSEGQEQGVLQETEADMITNIFEFSDKEARDIMTNRKAMVAIDANMSLKDAVNFMMDTNNSRFPVYLDDIDHIIGIMHIRDAMKKLSEETDEELPIRKIKGLLRQPKFVPETRNIDSLFHSMQSSKTQMVIIIDEYGQTAGLISMEDILEEIVGNIMDEYDEDENFVKPTKNSGEYIIEGKTPLEVLEKRFKISFGESEFETLNGYMISKLDRIPESDEEFSVTVDGYSFKILSVDKHMIQSVLGTKLPEEEAAQEEEELEIAK
ncbi:hemolysin family protein [Butyrivibrio sp. INlla14]|uniref:hemolysin family protein n=1 Tax=Butyrivibrio sp. INlla14 TaxID=1520808 RepID=UPI000876945F|nr:hemolysin family protein [Butyrivibrio sp. INlla14]SCY61188.1 putative hemolysin [Butyrivibrio sp. INlla14]